VNASIVSERLRLAGLVAGHGLTTLRRRAGGLTTSLASLRARAPDRLLIAPQDIRTADPTIANDIYAGWFSLSGRMVNTHGRSPFEIASPSRAWEDALEGFGWLRHLRAADTPLSRVNGRALVADWIALRGRSDRRAAWRPEIVARRLLSWLAQSPLILDGADRAFYRRFMKSIGRHGALLQHALTSGMVGEQRLLVCIALAELGLCAEGLGKLQRRSSKWLADELGRQILPDGGHIGRNPQSLVDLLLDLLPLRQAYAARSIPAPEALLNSIDRMMPMLRLFRHGDGSLALFNGMGVSEPDAIATALAYDDARAAALENAPWSGYQRIAHGDCVLVMDAGRPPPPLFSRRAHAGVLAFEMSSSGQPFLVNCGAADAERPSLRELARATAAHTTLVIGDASSCRFAAHSRLDRWLGGQIIGGPSAIKLARNSDDAGTMVEASHDGYERRFGLVHQRRLKLGSTGAVLEGEDRLEVSGRRVPGAISATYVVRFHLHPSVGAELHEDGSAATLTLADGQGWTMTAGGAPILIEESVFFAAPDGPRMSQQLAIHLDVRQAASVQWRLERRQPQRNTDLF
jgi:uncharacterized heparinase superfamily protein